MSKRWIQARKIPTEPPYGTYERMKRRLAEQAGHRCVYCGVTVSRYGEDHNFNIEHFRPESRMTASEIQAGEHRNPYNLFYACSMCNSLKSDDWPGEPNQLTMPVHIDPSLHDYHALFSINETTWIVESVHPAGRYVINRLGLNRDFLLQDRRTDAIFLRLLKVGNTLVDQINDGEVPSQLLPSACVILKEIMDVMYLAGNSGVLNEA